MNFNWDNDIYDRKQSRDTSNPEEENSLYLPRPLPRYFKIIGMAIAFLPVAYGVNALFLHLRFLEKVKVPDNLLLCIMAAGCLLETFADSPEYAQENKNRRDLLQDFLIAGVVISSAPSLVKLLMQLWT